MERTNQRSKKLVNRGIAAAVPLAIASSAIAQTTGSTSGDPSPMDYTTSISQFKDDLGTTLSTNGPVLMGALVVALGFGIVWKLIKRAAKSV